MFAAKVTVCVAAARSLPQSASRDSDFASGLLRHVNIMTIQNKHLIFDCRGPAAGQRVTDLERSSWIIRKQTGCRSQKNRNTNGQTFLSESESPRTSPGQMDGEIDYYVQNISRMNKKAQMIKKLSEKTFHKVYEVFLTQQLTKLDDF